MTVYTLVFCWHDKYNDGAVSTYSYSSLEKAVESACEVMESCVVNDGQTLVLRGKPITIDTFRDLLLKYRWFTNTARWGEDAKENNSWVRIDENVLDK